MCECPTGFDGEYCENNIDECVDHPCVHGICIDRVASFECDCTNTGRLFKYLEIFILLK